MGIPVLEGGNQSVFGEAMLLIKDDLFHFFLFSFSVSTVAQRLENVGQLNIKPRRVLKGHQGKVLCVDWSQDKRHVVSSSQVNKFFVLIY